MSTALRLTKNALTKQFTVASGQAVTVGEAVVFASADTEIQDAAGASDLAFGVAMATAAAGAQVDVYLLGYAVIPVVVGTGDATRGTKAKLAANGFTDATAHDSDGTGNESTYGIFMQSGTAGQTVGLLLSGAGNRGV